MLFADAILAEDAPVFAVFEDWVAMLPTPKDLEYGVGAGFVSYTVIQLLRGRWREVHWLMYLVSAVFGWYFFHGVVG